MAASRKSPLITLANRFDTGRGPGWSQAAKQLTDSGFRPSWARTSEPGITDSTLRDLYDKPRAGRLNAQKRAARRAEIDRYVSANRLSTRRLEPISESQTSRQRKAGGDVRRNLKVYGTGADSVGLGAFDVNAHSRPLSRFQIARVMSAAWAEFPGPGPNNDTHTYYVRLHLEVEYDKLPSTNQWYKYVEKASREPSRIRHDGSRTYVRVIIQLPTYRGEIESAARLAGRSANLGGTWASRFAEVLTGMDAVKSVLGFRISPRGDTGFSAE